MVTRVVYQQRHAGMTEIIVNATNKGGDGKTTLTIFEAEYFAVVKEKRILLIDLDPQANLSSRYLNMEFEPSDIAGKRPPIHPDYDDNDPEWKELGSRSSIADIFYGKPVLPYPTQFTNIEILPSYSGLLQDAEAVKKTDITQKVHQRMHEFLSLKDVRDLYDIIIIDTPPSKGPLTISAIKAASHLVIPCQMERFPIEGIYGMLQLWKQETFTRSANNPITLIGILANKFDQTTTLHKDMLSELHATNGIRQYLFPYKLHRRTKYSKFLAEGAVPRSIFELGLSTKERVECTQVCDFIYTKVFSHDTKHAEEKKTPWNKHISA